MPEINNTWQTNGTEKSLVVWEAYLLKAACMNIDISPSQRMDNLACAKTQHYIFQQYVKQILIFFFFFDKKRTVKISLLIGPF